MPVIEWNDGLSVGVEEIDNDHKVLINLINELFISLEEGDPHYCIEECFDRLEDYIHRHFSREEALMEQYGYTGRAAHKTQHRDFSDRVRELKAELISSGSREVTEKAIDFLTQWLIHHIVAEDTKLAHLIKAAREQSQSASRGLVSGFTQRVPFRTRAMLTALIPTLGMVLLSLYIVFNSAAKVTALQDLEQLYQLADESSNLVHSLQAERGLSIGLVDNKPVQFQDRIQTLRGNSDRAIVQFQAYLRDFQQASEYPFLSSLSELLEQRADELSSIRQTIDNRQLPSADIKAFYTSYIEQLLQIADQMTHVQMPNQINNSIRAYISLIHYKEKLGLERALGLKAIEDGKLEGADKRLFYQLLGQQQALLQVFYNAATPELTDPLVAEQRSAISSNVVRLQQRLVEAVDQNKLSQLSGIDWWKSFTDKMNQLQRLLDQLSRTILVQSEAYKAEQSQIMWLTMVLTGLLLVMLWWLSRLLVRSVIEPVEKVTQALSRLARGDRTVLLGDSMADDELRQILTAYERCRVEIMQGSFDEARSLLHQQKAERYRTLSAVDPLTGLFNRRRFDELGKVEMERAVRFNSPVTLLMIDLDRFKQVNDRFGHHFGDHVLQEISQALHRQARSSDILARIGGEEFAMLLPLTRLEQARPLLDRLLEEVRELRFECDGQPLRTTISIGVTMWDGQRHDDLLTWLLDQADQALYLAKQQGRDCYREVETGSESESAPSSAN